MRGSLLAHGAKTGRRAPLAILSNHPSDSIYLHLRSRTSDARMWQRLYSEDYAAKMTPSGFPLPIKTTQKETVLRYRSSKPLPITYNGSQQHGPRPTTDLRHFIACRFASARDNSRNKNPQRRPQRFPKPKPRRTSRSS
ncbi:Protein of unknown function [Pyronema omphalodes CBS 100304]|uniref:Uncharacterized protein n=1 Tax=Pyronema omphalodes (strain CBS 100304) TaxID=1076935 RepID=U4LEK5_PYROM|nr:Protein of unknown function [Pyronema omphalodes CBS 100304]